MLRYKLMLLLFATGLDNNNFVFDPPRLGLPTTMSHQYPWGTGEPWNLGSHDGGHGQGHGTSAPPALRPVLGGGLGQGPTQPPAAPPMLGGGLLIPIGDPSSDSNIDAQNPIGGNRDPLVNAPPFAIGFPEDVTPLNNDNTDETNPSVPEIQTRDPIVRPNTDSDNMGKTKPPLLGRTPPILNTQTPPLPIFPKLPSDWLRRGPIDRGDDARLIPESENPTVTQPMETPTSDGPSIIDSGGIPIPSVENVTTDAPSDPVVRNENELVDTGGIPTPPADNQLVRETIDFGQDAIPIPTDESANENVESIAPDAPILRLGGRPTQSSDNSNRNLLTTPSAQNAFERFDLGDDARPIPTDPRPNEINRHEETNPMGVHHSESTTQNGVNATPPPVLSRALPRLKRESESFVEPVVEPFVDPFDERFVDPVEPIYNPDAELLDIDYPRAVELSLKFFAAQRSGNFEPSTGVLQKLSAEFENNNNKENDNNDDIYINPRLWSGLLK